MQYGFPRYQRSAGVYRSHVTLVGIAPTRVDVIVTRNQVLTHFVYPNSILVKPTNTCGLVSLPQEARPLLVRYLDPSAVCMN